MAMYTASYFPYRPFLSSVPLSRICYTVERKEIFRGRRYLPWSSIQGFVKNRNLYRYMSFIVRARVLKLYRQALRTAQRAPTHARDELRQTMRQELEKNRHCDDKQKIRFLMSEGLQRLKDLDEMLDMQGHH